MAKIKIDTAQPDYAALRQLVLERLRAAGPWGQIQHGMGGLDAYVDLDPARPNGLIDFERTMVDVFWELVALGIVAPGNGVSQPNFPWFRLTPYGKSVLESPKYHPHDRDGYISLLTQRVANADATVLAYLDESLESFVRANNVAAMVMLGVAAERVFDLLSESLLNALKSPTERQELSRLLERFTMKPKVDWVHAKLREVQERKPKLQGFPENAALMVTAIYDLIRAQRNDLGHPRDFPPKMSAGDSHANLLIFPRYYETSEVVRAFLASTTV
jgi:hypothetical protein